MEVTELRMLRWTCGKTMLDMIPNGVYRAELEMETIIREGRLRWFGHDRRRPQSTPVRRVEALVVDGMRRKGRPKLSHWRAATGVICDRNVSLKLKGKFYRAAIRPAMLYASECWHITKALANRMEVAELRMLRWTCGKTMLDMIPNGVYRAELEMETIIREGRLRWFGHVRRRPQSAPVRRVEALVVDGFACECFSCLVSFLLFLFGFCVLDSDRVEFLIESISTDLEFFDDSYATKAKKWFTDSLEASESTFSTSGRVLSIRRTRRTPASLEMCMCLKDHLDAQERKEDKSTLETPVDFKKEILDAEVQENEAFSLSDEEIAVDVASSEGSMFGPGSGGEEAADYGYDVYHDD
nr:putative reverse transcriptase domain-containing protein [Tanacetum cinerariifolium]